MSRTTSCRFCIFNCYYMYLQESSRLCNWLSLRWFAPWINHLPSVWWSTLWKSRFKRQLVCKFYIEESFCHCLIIFIYLHISRNSIIHYFIFTLFSCFKMCFVLQSILVLTWGGEEAKRCMVLPYLHFVRWDPASITMTSQWAWWRLRSPASRLFTQPFIRVQFKENIKARRHWPLCGEFTGDRWILRTNGQ